MHLFTGLTERVGALSEAMALEMPVEYSLFASVPGFGLQTIKAVAAGKAETPFIGIIIFVVTPRNIFNQVVVLRVIAFLAELVEGKISQRDGSVVI